METKSNPHHLVLGKLNDFLTDAVFPDTFDERYRQKIAKKLVMDNGFNKSDIIHNIPLHVFAGEKKASLKVDFLIRFENKTIVLIKYAPGSLVTRRLSTLALSRIIEPYQIPIVVVTNGEDAEIIDGSTGNVIFVGLENLPDKKMIKERISSFSFNAIEKSIFEKASRIAYACEIDGACACDSDICIVE